MSDALSPVQMLASWVIAQQRPGRAATQGQIITLTHVDVADDRPAAEYEMGPLAQRELRRAGVLRK